MHTCICIYIYTYTHTYIYIYIYTQYIYVSLSQPLYRRRRIILRRVLKFSTSNNMFTHVRPGDDYNYDTRDVLNRDADDTKRPFYPTEYRVSRGMRELNGIFFAALLNFVGCFKKLNAVDLKDCFEDHLFHALEEAKQTTAVETASVKVLVTQANGVHIKHARKREQGEIFEECIRLCYDFMIRQGESTLNKRSVQRPVRRLLTLLSEDGQRRTALKERKRLQDELRRPRKD